MVEFFALIPPDLLLFACGVTLLAGFVKGVVGFAMPLVMISGLGILIDPQIAVACIILPTLMTNVLQVMRAGFGKAQEALKDHWRYVVMVCGTILLTTQFVRLIPVDTMYIMLGIPVVGLCLVQLAGWRPRIRQEKRRAFEISTGFVAGVLGGFAGTWGPPTVLYLLALETPRDRQMAVQGVVYSMGSVMLFTGHVQSGIFNAQTWPISAALLVPAFLGMWWGGRLGDKFDQDKFRQLTLLILVVAGGNLIRRGLMG